MTAETIKESEHRLHELRQDEWSDLGLGALALGLALAASFLHPPLAVRRALAQSLRVMLTPATGYSCSPRLAEAADELRTLASELDDEGLSLDPPCAVRCHQLVNNYADSPLLNKLLSEEDLHVWIRRIRCGFEPNEQSSMRTCRSGVPRSR
jgi:hypothetical protein